MTNKGVSFNVSDPEQKELYDYAIGKSNFSGYVKMLIQRDKERKERAVAAASQNGVIRIDLNQRNT